MAVNYDLLVTGLNIQEIIVDKLKPNSVSQLASGAQVFFYKPDKVTPKNVYIETGDAQNPFTVSSNPLTLNAAGAASQKLYYYFFDESVDDPTDDDQELYYIQVVNLDGETIYEVMEFIRNPPTSGGGSITTNELINLAPDYGLDVLYRPDYYGDLTGFYLTTVATHFALGYLWYISDPTIGDFSYNFVAPSIGDLAGDPLHYVILSQTNFASDQTNIWVGFPICQYQELIGSTINLQFLAQDQSSVAVTSLPIGIVRSPSVDDTTGLIDWASADSPANVGTATLSTSFDTKTVSFTMPAVTGSFDESSSTYITIGLPKDQDFKIALTGFYVYRGDVQTLNIGRDNLGNRYARVFAQAMSNIMLSQDNSKSDSLPVMRDGRSGAFNFQNRTGSFFQGSPQPTFPYNFALAASGKNVVEGYTYGEGGNPSNPPSPADNILSDRLLNNVDLSALNGPNNFLVSGITATSFFVQTRLIHKPVTSWTSNSSVLQINVNGQLSQHIVNAEVDSVNLNQVNITFTSNYFALTYGYDATPSSFVYTTPPPQSVIINWFGTITPTTTIPLLKFNATPGIGQGVLNNGSGATPASAYISFPSTGLTAAQLKSTYNAIPVSPSYTQYTNCLQFLNPDNSGASQLPKIPPYAIQFKVDGEGDDVEVSDTLLTVNLDSSNISDGTVIASEVAATLNNSDFFEFVFSGVPTNGENFLFSSTYKSFIGIFWVTNQLKPINPDPSRPAIYIQIAPGATVQDVVNSTSTAFTQKISSIPTAGNLGITLGTNLSLFMEA